MRSSLPALAALTAILALVSAPLRSQAPTLTLPAFTGYAHPDADAIERRDDGSVPRCDGELRFYVQFATAGELTVRIERTDGGKVQPVHMRMWRVPIEGSDATDDLLQHKTKTDTVGFFVAVGSYCLALCTDDGKPLRDLRALHLTGPAVANAHANVAERRNAASVHLGYEVPKAHRDEVAWFYVELTPRTDPLWTYYMATGWHRGYFGMQVNSPRERRLIFSVWDAGDEAVDRKKVDATNRVTLVAKGERVHAGDFGNEGTGGHSHLVHDWRLGDTFRFLLHAQKDGDATIYSGFFWFAAEKRWGLIASFRAPKDGKLPHGLYSFSENFHGGNGDRARDCEFGNAWVRTTAGEWLPLRSAKFTHDGTGKDVRRDRLGGVRGNRFFLRHGDFATPPANGPMRYGHALQVEKSDGEHPRDDELPTPPMPTPR